MGFFGEQPQPGHVNTPGGMTILLKSLGINPDEIRASIESFMVGQRALLEKINENQTRLEAAASRTELAVAALSARLGLGLVQPSTVEYRGPNGEATGVLATTEKFPQRMIDEAMSEGEQ